MHTLTTKQRDACVSTYSHGRDTYEPTCSYTCSCEYNESRLLHFARNSMAIVHGAACSGDRTNEAHGPCTTIPTVCMQLCHVDIAADIDMILTYNNYRVACNVLFASACARCTQEVRCRYGAGTVQVWCRYGAGTVQVRCRYGAGGG